MTQEQKDLLLKDLCSRLPYGVKCEVIKRRIDGEMVFIRNGMDALELTVNNIKELVTNNLYEIKPYLFPLSSMTEEQKIELNRLGEEECDIIEYVVNNPNPKNIGFPIVTHYMVDWCDKNHFDYRGLIPMGLAIDATELNIY